MIMSDQLPVCTLCGGSAWIRMGRVSCMTPDCSAYGLEMAFHTWRRIMSSPTLAPEYVEALRRVVSLFASAKMVDWAAQAAAIRAALAELGEE